MYYTHTYIHYNWDINIEAESFVSENGRNTQDNCTQTESMETDTEDENPGFVIEQDQSQDECPYCQGSTLTF
jgi:hypothetical protein